MCMRLEYNYHTHTVRCGHASGTEEEYIINAIKAGYKELGFSDHMMIRGYSQPHMRGDFDTLKDYVDVLRQLKEKYKDQINIHIGLECEYFPQIKDYYKELVDELGIKYLIIGQHCFMNEEGKICWAFGLSNLEECLEKYTTLLIEGMSTGLFKYVCHPDLFFVRAKCNNPLIEKYSKMICEASIKYDIPLEINLCGARRKIDYDDYSYPSPIFWKIASKYHVKVVIGVDAHNPLEMIYSKKEYAFDIIRRYNLNYMEDYHL